MSWPSTSHVEHDKSRASDHLFWAMTVRKREPSRMILGFHCPDDFCDFDRLGHRGVGTRSASARRPAEAAAGLSRPRAGLSVVQPCRKRDFTGFGGLGERL